MGGDRIRSCSRRKVALTAALALAVALVANPSAALARTAWSRLAGPIALDTMASIVSDGWSSGSCDSVVVASVDGYWDALSASSLAGALDCPVVLTKGTSLSSQARAAISRVGAKRAYVLGGTAAISGSVSSALSSIGVTPERVGGATATGTAVAVATETRSIEASDTCLIASSTGYWDSLSAAPYAYSTSSPVLLAEPDGKLSKATVSAIRSAGYRRAVIVGGTAAVSASVEGQLSSAGCSEVVRKAGATATGTNVALVEWELTQGMKLDGLGVASLDGYWDALTGAALCGRSNSVLLLANDRDRSAIDATYRKALTDGKPTVSSGEVFGGTAAVSAATWRYLNSYPQWKTTPAWDETIVDKAAWDEPVYKTVTDYEQRPVYEKRVVCICGDGTIFETSAEAKKYVCGKNISYFPAEKMIQVGTETVAVGSHQEQVDTIHHPAVSHVVHHEAVTEQVWVQD